MTADEEIVASLLGAGIGTRFHRRTLGEFGPAGATLRDWVQSGQFEDDVHAGQAWNLLGGVDAHDLSFVLARACHLKGVGVRVLSLNKLVEAILEGSLDEIENAPALFLHGFFIRDFPICPLTPVQRMKVEDFLMSRMDEQRAVFLQSTDQIANTTPWWSSIILQRVSQVNRELFA